MKYRLLALLLCVVPCPVCAEPLPLKVAVSLREHNTRSTFMFSPDGELLAHTMEEGDTLKAANRLYTSAGAPLAEGFSRMTATLTRVRDGKSLALGGPHDDSWAPVISPDGKRVAFFSDHGVRHSFLNINLKR